MYWLLRVIVFLFSKLPLSVLQTIASGIGILMWHILRARRRVAIINAKIIGASNPVKTARESFKNSFMSYLEVAYVQNIDKKFLDNNTDFINTEILEKLRDNNEKFALITAHIGAWDFAVPTINKEFGIKLLIVGKESNSKALDTIISMNRNSDSVIYVTQSGFLEKAQQCEKLGYITGSLLDHSTTRSDSVIAPFFGLRVRTLAGIPALCVRKNIPMLPCYMLRNGRRFKFIVHDPIYPNKELKPKERIVDLCTQMNESYEKIISEYPEQWYLLHKRFKKVEEPDGTISDRIYRS